MPVSLIAPTDNDTPIFYGWGGPTRGILNEGTFTGMVFVPNTDDLTLNLNYAPTWPGPFLCGGDSGGPGVRLLAVNMGGGAAQATAIVGTESIGSKINGTSCSGPAAGMPNLFDTLVRTDTLVTSFIEPSMRDYEGDNFSCTRETEDTSNGVQTYAECWKKACSTDSDCALPNPNAFLGSDAGPSTRVPDGDGGVTVYFCAGASTSAPPRRYSVRT